MKSNRLGMMGEVGPSDSSLWLKTERYRAISHYQTPPPYWYLHQNLQTGLPRCWMSLHFWHSLRNLRQPAELRRISLQVILPLPKGLVMITSSFTLPSATGCKRTHIWFKNLNKKNPLTNPALESVQTESTCIGSQVRVHVHIHHGVHRAEEVPSHAGYGREQIVEALERIVEYRVKVSGVTVSQNTGEEEARGAELSLFSHLRDNKKMKRNNDLKRRQPGVLQLDLNPKAKSATRWRVLPTGVAV